MPNIKNYIEEYGDISFKERPFSDCDNVALCHSFYMPFHEVLSEDDTPTPYRYAAYKMFARRGNKHKDVGLILLRYISKVMLWMAQKKRFQEMKMVKCKHVYKKNPDVQFDACTYLLPDGEVVVVYKGTDDSLRGWKEDFDIIMNDDIPSNNLSVQYLKEVAETYDGDIIVCGHSKGGYIALYAALNSEKEVRDRIKRLYNNDGQGMKDYSFLDSEAYKELLPRYRHFVPQSSLIGMLLCHDNDYKVIKSNRVSGPMQHDLWSWQMKEGELVFLKSLTSLGKTNDETVKSLLASLSDNELKSFNNILISTLDDSGIDGLIEFKTNTAQTIKRLLASRKEISKSDEKTAVKIGKRFASSFAESSKDVIKSKINGKDKEN